MTRKNKIKLLFIPVFLLVFAFYFNIQNVQAAGFGEACTRADDCIGGLKCLGNTCVKCNKQADCGPSETCDDGVCLGPNGNGEGDFCANSDQCVSKNCSTTTNLCQADSGGGDNGGDGNGDKDTGTNPLGGFPGEDLEFGDITNIIVGLACWLMRVASTLAAIFVILAGFRFMMAGGNPEKHQQAIKNFQTVLWGILVIYGVYVIIATVANAVGITDFSFIPLVC